MQIALERMGIPVPRALQVFRRPDAYNITGSMFGQGTDNFASMLAEVTEHIRDDVLSLLTGGGKEEWTACPVCTPPPGKAHATLPTPCNTCGGALYVRKEGTKS